MQTKKLIKTDRYHELDFGVTFPKQAKFNKISFAKIENLHFLSKKHVSTKGMHSYFKRSRDLGGLTINYVLYTWILVFFYSREYSLNNMEKA